MCDGSVPHPLVGVSFETWRRFQRGGLQNESVTSLRPKVFCRLLSQFELVPTKAGLKPLEGVVLTPRAFIQSQPEVGLGLIDMHRYSVWRGTEQVRRSPAACRRELPWRRLSLGHDD